MKRHKTEAVTAVVALALILLLIIWAAGGSAKRHATCWAHPGHFTADGGVVFWPPPGPPPSPEFRRHGRGSTHGICGT